MHKKIALVSLALLMVFAMVTAASAASAPKAMANTTQKGSLLIWPKIVISATDPWVDTIIFLSNDNAAQVWVQCYWMDENQTVEDFNFKLTPNQPIFFSAMFGQNLPLFPIVLDPPVTVPPFNPGTYPLIGGGVGSLFCWAVNDEDSSAKVYNHLYGNALIVSGYEDDGIYIEGTVLYNAFSFVEYLAPAAPVNGVQQLDLDGLVYDACPSYLLANFTPYTEILNPEVYPALTLVPCKQDLTQDRVGTYTKAKFDIWNANETKYTGAYQCFKCFAEFYLDEIGEGSQGKNVGTTYSTTWKKIGVGFGGDKFEPFALKTVANRFRVSGIPSTVCKFPSGNGVYTGLLGLILYEDDFIYAGTTLHGAGLANTANDKGWIKWDIGSGSQEAAGK